MIFGEIFDRNMNLVIKVNNVNNCFRILTGKIFKELFYPKIDNFLAAYISISRLLAKFEIFSLRFI
jgi:hypothetical protein